MSERRDRQARVIVVGGGVSGCACAAALADAGFEVMVVNSALDTVGMPAYGPDLLGEEGGWDTLAKALAPVPRVLREVWLAAAMVPVGARDSGQGAGFRKLGAACPAMLNVDRRMISIETKRVLEKVPGLTFRQGLIRDIRVGGPAAAVAVETVFGEVFEADALVIAVGLSMGGQVTVGSDRLPGGRYGEMPSDGLREALERLGVEFHEATVEVGGRIGRNEEGFIRVTASLEEVAAGGGTDEDHHHVPPGTAATASTDGGPRVAGLIPARSALTGLFEQPLEDGDPSTEAACSPVESAALGRVGTPDVTPRDATAAMRWPADFSPAPHWDRSLRMDRIVLCSDRDGAGFPLFSPDGAATGEVYRSEPRARGPLGSEEGGPDLQALQADELLTTRLRHSVRGLAVRSVGEDGRVLAAGMPVGPVWVSGRAGGAADYLESLTSGVCAAKSVAAFLRVLGSAAEPEREGGGGEKEHTQGEPGAASAGWTSAEESWGGSA